MVPEHGAALPLMLDGEGAPVLDVTASVDGVEVPQPLVAVTEIFPEEPPAVSVMLAVVELPVHPAGAVHV